MFSNIHLRVYSVRVLCTGLMYMSVNHFTFKTCHHIVIQDEAPYLYAFFFISACLNKEWLMAALIFLASVLASVRYCTAADAFTPSLIVPLGISCLLLLYFIFLILYTFI